MDILYHRKKRITTQLNYNILNSFAMRNIPGHFRIFLGIFSGFFIWIIASLFGDFHQFFDLFSPN